jgi:hypothetical protein
MTNLNQTAYKQVLDSGGTLKEPNAPLPAGAGDAIASYLLKFPYKINIKVGQTYTQNFKEFNAWCEKTLGVKYKDWFLIGHAGINNPTYTLYLKDSKKSMFLALKYSEIIDTAQLSC